MLLSHFGKKEKSSQERTRCSMTMVVEEDGVGNYNDDSSDDEVGMRLRNGDRQLNCIPSSAYLSLISFISTKGRKERVWESDLGEAIEGRERSTHEEKRRRGIP